ncbi:MAG TPA: carboxypeptidase regulatory-like domain-containing protein [Candidatus Polarisedimenticolia bacterium]|nr:carboxypeptidase regulatory-like domain-containing protein [Candidatus Polarisedimenticolia bacterium]
MSIRKSLVAGAVILSLAGLGAGLAVAGTISGTVTYEGKVPNLKPIAMDADPSCAKKHTGPVPSDVLVLGDGNTMANILVRVVGGLPAGKTWPAPTTPAVMDQNGCHYQPHVLGIQVGQPFKILNSDGILHNVHSLPKINKPFNMAMPGNRTEASTTFDKAENIFPVKCDVHPWMSAFIAVLTNPFYAVTAKDGKFSIPNLDPGTYEVEAWHEKLGTQKMSVTVGADTKPIAFKFTAPAAK